MSTANSLRFLSNAGATDDRHIAMEEVFDLTVREAFYADTTFFDRDQAIFQFREVTDGKSFQFNQFGNVPTPNNYRPGQELLGTDYVVDKSTITPDDYVVDSAMIPGDQVAMANFDIVAPIVRNKVRTIREDLEKKLVYTAVKASRESALTKTVPETGNTLTIHNGGNVVSRVGASGVTAAYPATKTGAYQFRDDVAQMAQLMDEDYVPAAGRHLFITPYLRRVLGKDETIFNRDINSGDAGNRLNSRAIGELEGFMVHVTTFLPSANITSTSLSGTADLPLASKYQGDFAYDGTVGQPAALALCGASEGRGAVGVVSDGGIKSELWWDPSRLSWRAVFYVRFGAGILHPYCAGEIRVTDS